MRTKNKIQANITLKEVCVCVCVCVCNYKWLYVERVSSPYLSISVTIHPGCSFSAAVVVVAGVSSSCSHLPLLLRLLLANLLSKTTKKKRNVMSLHVDYAIIKTAQWIECQRMSFTDAVFFTWDIFRLILLYLFCCKISDGIGDSASLIQSPRILSFFFFLRYLGRAFKSSWKGVSVRSWINCKTVSC